MRTPEEIKRGLECCLRDHGCSTCPYAEWRGTTDGCVVLRNTDAASYIRRSEETYRQLKKSLQDRGFEDFEGIFEAYEKLKTRLDEALEQWKDSVIDGESLCETCALCDSEGRCFVECDDGESWKWRGVKEGQHEGD